jgi:threonylcarbamoyladenosine tRNA methylthiotransferase MtaB
MPHCCIGVDVIVGFPGETNEDFEESYRFLNELDISYLHVFTYSERPNTTAIEMEGVVNMEERRRRNKMLTILSEKKKRFFYEQFVGDIRPVLFEKSKEENKISGFTDNYIRIDMPLEESLLNEIGTVQLNTISPEGLMQSSFVPTEISSSH